MKMKAFILISALPLILLALPLILMGCAPHCKQGDVYIDRKCCPDKDNDNLCDSPSRYSINEKELTDEQKQELDKILKQEGTTEVTIEIENIGDELYDGFAFDLATYGVFKVNCEEVSTKSVKLLMQHFTFDDKLSGKATIQKKLTVFSFIIPPELFPEECKKCKCDSEISYQLENLGKK